MSVFVYRVNQVGLGHDAQSALAIRIIPALVMVDRYGEIKANHREIAPRTIFLKTI